MNLMNVNYLINTMFMLYYVVSRKLSPLKSNFMLKSNYQFEGQQERVEKKYKCDAVIINKLSQ